MRDRQTIDQRLGGRVAELRRAAGITQAALARRAGVVSETISRLECGHAMPSLARLEAVARTLNVELRDLFRFEPEPVARGRSLDRLFAVLKGRSTSEIDLVIDLAKRIFRDGEGSRHVRRRHG